MLRKNVSGMEYIRLLLKYRFIRLMHLFGIKLYLNTEDRKILENKILRHISESNGYQTILFVGCDWYTSGYKKLFKSKKYFTIEIDPKMSRYGTDLHIIDSITNIEKHFLPNSLDIVICNGVFGFGLNDEHEVIKAFEGIYNCVREGGVFILGWNDLPAYRPFDVRKLNVLSKFAPYRFPSLETNEYRVNNEHQHVFNFYTK